MKAATAPTPRATRRAMEVRAGSLTAHSLGGAASTGGGAKGTSRKRLRGTTGGGGTGVSTNTT